jgi:single-strand selective monofunctional uracil DNA glycosylase
VRDWLGITAPVGAPAVQHPKRLVTGFACARREVSGQRLWGWAAARSGGDAQRFFADFWVANYCPVAWMSATGANVTPNQLPKEYRAQVLAACDDALRCVSCELLCTGACMSSEHRKRHRRTIALLQPRALVGVGSFAAARLRACSPKGTTVVVMPHPSPASPAANKDWAGQADAVMRAAGLLPDAGGAAA